MLKLRKAGISRSAVQETLGCSYPTIVGWERHAMGRWDEKWKAYYEDQDHLISQSPIDRLDALLARLGRELYAAAMRDPVHFLNECGQLLERLAPTTMIVENLTSEARAAIEESLGEPPGTIIRVNGDIYHGR